MRVQDLVWFLVLGFVGISLNYLFFFRSLELTTVSTAVTLVYTYSIMVTVCAAILLREQLTRTAILCAGLATVGCFLIAQVYDPDAFQLNRAGLLFGMGAAVTKTVYTLITKHLLGLCRKLWSTCCTFARFDPTGGWSAAMFGNVR
ncbi:drug/metabolite transporter, DME family [Ruegeria halocynthiae]|uniref:Drug/metabolite transporter, DME family n=1 Tax=Ruegeria halocynthiae TaxID=985054 RepID=A0A1H3G320_9RHOB|nr:drug/metabolite transporter, DME family [Ruegeria halocynthiae]